LVNSHRILARVLTLAILAAPPAPADYGDALDTRGGGIANRYVLHAQELIAHGHITDALAQTNHALALYPHFIGARFTHGLATMAGGDYATALSDFTQVIAAHPEYPLVYEIRALAYLRDRKPNDAILDLNRALTAKLGMGRERAARVFGYRSLAYQMLGQNDAAIADLQRALAPLDGQLDNYSMLGFTCYAAAVVNLLDTAQLLCDESISRKNRNLIAYEARGLVDLKQRAWDKVIADDTRMLGYREDQPMALYGRGLAKRARGDSKGGAADIAAAIAIEPDIAGIMTRLGVADAAGGH
jgi:tetratricopeptide (TPR) repeat protein